MDFPKTIKLSGRSCGNGILLLVERWDDRRDMGGSSTLLSHDEPEDVVNWLLRLSATEPFLACLLSARKRSGDGGSSNIDSLKAGLPRLA